MIDVRSPEEYAEGHPPGAPQVPIDQVPSRLDEIPGDRPVVTYRTMRRRGTMRNEKAAALLRASGHDAQSLGGGVRCRTGLATRSLGLEDCALALAKWAAERMPSMGGRRS